MRPLHFIVEGSHQVGLGHVFMTLALLEECRILGLNDTVAFVIGDLGLSVMQERSPCPVLPFSEWQQHDHNGACVGINVRAPEILDIKSLRAQSKAVLVTDELGKRKLAADFLHNPTPVSTWYRPADEYSQVFYGLRYYIMRRDFLPYVKQEKAGKGAAKRLLVAMGGVDRTGATVHLAKALNSIYKELTVDVTIVMGPGFPHEAELRSVAPLDSQWTLLRDPACLPEIIHNHDLLLSAGGNMMFEAASLGVPSLVFWEDWHEELRGKAAAELGFARCIGRGVDVDHEVAAAEIAAAVQDPFWLTQGAMTGRQAIDGQGGQRLLRELLEALA